MLCTIHLQNSLGPRLQTSGVDTTQEAQYCSIKPTNTGSKWRKIIKNCCPVWLCLCWHNLLFNLLLKNFHIENSTILHQTATWDIIKYFLRNQIMGIKDNKNAGTVLDWEYSHSEKPSKWCNTSYFALSLLQYTHLLVRWSHKLESNRR